VASSEKSKYAQPMLISGGNISESCFINLTCKALFMSCLIGIIPFVWALVKLNQERFLWIWLNNIF
jgi:hypothetical protein